MKTIIIYISVLSHICRISQFDDEMPHVLNITNYYSYKISLLLNNSYNLGMS